MRAERRVKRAKSREEGEDALATADNLIRCTGKEQSAGGDTTSKDASSQTDPVLLPVDEGYISKNQELSAKIVALQEVDSFHYSYGRYILQLNSQQGGDTTSKDASSQTDPVLLPVDEGYISKNQELSAKIVALQEVDSFHYSYGKYILQLMSGSDNKTTFYTGLPTYTVFKALFDFLELKMLHALRDSDTSHLSKTPVKGGRGSYL